MITRYDFGHPLNTGAVVQSIPASRVEIPFFTVQQSDAGLSFRIKLDDEDMIFGLGEALGGIDKRGHRYVSWNSDDANHTEDKASLYGSHNFMVFVKQDALFGVYFDDPGEMVLDLGWSRPDEAVVTSVNGDVAVYFICGETSAIDVCRSFRQLTGRSYIPPKWAFGYIQSRWGYKTQDDLLTVLQEHRTRHIPLDGVSMDIDYMDDYRDFTWDAASFPDLKAFSDKLHSEHARLIPIIDAGIKLDPGYDVYEEAIAQDLVCKKADGTPFVGAVWPGRCVFPDFLKPEARQWFGKKYHRLLAAGMEGFWNDMSEPALFYSDETLKAAFDEADTLRGQNLGIWGTFRLRDVMLGIANNREDFSRFYQVLDGQSICHDRVHNLYGATMTQAAAEGFKSFDPDKRFLLFSRSSFIGSHRYGGIWQGDNQSWWSHILLNLKELASLNMTGFLYNGADLGGFGSNTSPDLLQRWLQLGVFTPLMRNHSAIGTRNQQIYQFTNWEQMRDTLTVRYALIPYLYSEFMQAALTDGMMFRPLAFDYPEDRTACHTEDQLMLGHDCMIAPVYEQNAAGRHVYLPQDMLMVRFISASEYELVPVPAGHCYVNLVLNQFPLFIRKGHVIPLAASAEYVEAIDETVFTLIGWMDSDTEARTMLYRDNGFTTSPSLEEGLTEIRVVADGDTVKCQADKITLDASGILVDA